MTKETFLLEGNIRTDDLNAKNLRDSKRIPAVLYGKDTSTLNIDLDYKDFRKIYKAAGESTIIDLKAGDKTYKVLVHDVQFDPISDLITHVDFLNIAMDKLIDAEIPFEFVGVAPAVKDLAGVLFPQKHSIKVRCLPKDLPQKITIDVSSLATFHDSIHVKDVVLPEGVKALDDASLTVVTVVAPKKEEEVAAPLPTAAEVTGAVPAEGEAAEGEAAGKEAGKEKGDKEKAAPAKEEKK
ncbi:50S ribosomal protein L25 [Candidatus Peregrinibacteria bacterium]|nr:50S ribosomal protein L25 [Candidatus Peregrinibacteria bacterium]